MKLYILGSGICVPYAKRGSSGYALAGDTDYSEALIELTKDTDLLVIECSLHDEASKRKGHLPPGEVVEITNKSGAKKIVVTPLSDMRRSRGG